MLGHLGYESEGARTGTEAVELYRKSLREGSPYAAVIMDLTIPGDIGGKEVINILCKDDPAVRGVVSSGYSDDPIFSDHTAFGFKAILRKPFRLEELAEALKTALS
jgi:CheY-like chemotaxis protein